ncbi:hypothetical protein L208DRAFT_1389779 [Tricholoma matsutake]|nr:hypothetical protein L208DRAFT_1389779 [Tricholoma matsutake 945]
MDVDVDTGDVANRGEQSGAVDVDMREGSMNEHDKAPNDATPESSPLHCALTKGQSNRWRKAKEPNARGKNKENRPIAPSTAKNKVKVKVKAKAKTKTKA